MNAVFIETIKCLDGILHHSAYHQERVNRTVSDFYGKELDISFLHACVPDFACKGLFKCRVLYDDVVRHIEFVPYEYKTIKKAGVIVAETIHYPYKFADRTNLDFLLQGAACDEIILIQNNLVTDAHSSNLVFEAPHGFYTPSDYLLPGTKRKWLLDKGKIAEKRIRVEEIADFEYVYFINAMRDLKEEFRIAVKELVYF